MRRLRRGMARGTDLAKQEEAPMTQWTNRIAVFDLETTGIDVETDRIVTAFVGLIDGEGTVERGTDWLADPGIPIPERAAEVHGITTEIAQAEGRPALEVVTELRAALDWIARHSVPLVIYNAPYDLTLFARECARHGISEVVFGEQVVDPLVIDRAVDKYRKGKRTLTDTSVFYGIELIDAHSAGDDAVAAGQLALALAAKYPAELDVPLAELHAKQATWAADQARDFEAYMRAQRDPEFTADTGWPVRAAR